MKLFQNWLFAIKINSWPKMLVPFFWGQCLGAYATLRFDINLFLIGFLFTFFLTIFIVLLNDYWDQNVDSLKRKLYPNSGSPKTIPDGILPAWQVLIVGLFSGLLVCLISFGIEEILHRTLFSILGSFCIFIFIFYSVPPIRFNYIGGGEFLEMIGVGAVLPFLNFYLQSNEIDISHYVNIFISSLIFALASAIASGLSDEVSDRMGGKTTFVILIGNDKSRKLILFLSLLALIVLGVTPIFHSEVFHWWDSGLFFVFGLYLLQKLYRSSKLAKTDCFPEIQIFKTYLHYLIWGNFILVGVLLLSSSFGIRL